MLFVCFIFSFSQTILLWEDTELDSIKPKILMLSFSKVVLNRKAGRKTGEQEGRKEGREVSLGAQLSLCDNLGK